MTPLRGPFFTSRSVPRSVALPDALRDHVAVRVPPLDDDDAATLAPAAAFVPTIAVIVAADADADAFVAGAEAELLCGGGNGRGKDRGGRQCKKPSAHGCSPRSDCTVV